MPKFTYKDDEAWDIIEAGLRKLGYMPYREGFTWKMEIDTGPPDFYISVEEFPNPQPKAPIGERIHKRVASFIGNVKGEK